MKCFLLLQLFLFTQVCSQSVRHGTTFAFVRTNESIYLGSESKEIDIVTINQKDTMSSKTIDKIKTIDNVAFIAGGFYGSPESKLDVFSILETACRSNGNVYEKAVKFEKLIQAPLLSAWNFIEKLNPPENPKERFVLTIIAGFIKNLPVIIVQKFDPIIKDNLTVSVDSKAAIYPPDEKTLNSLYAEKYGMGDFNKIPSSSFTPSYKTNPVGWIKSVIQKAILLDSTYNGYPIKILRITKSGFKWMK